MRAFFTWSDDLDRYVLKPLEHIRANWELGWDHDEQRYSVEEDSFASLLNALIEEVAMACPPSSYHDSEDRLAQYVVENLNWPIRKVGARWVGADYGSILEQGVYQDADEADIVFAASGRIWAALDRGQVHFDQMEESHRQVLATVLAIVLYHRGASEF